VSEIKRIQSQLRRAYEGPAWHGPSIKELLSDVNAEKAAARPVAGAHSIWELVLHISAWEDGARRRLSGDRAELSTEEDWPPVKDTDDAAWRKTLEALETSNRRLREALDTVDEARLNEPILEGMSSVYATLHGVVQHGLYHAGQIALLKKA
jgi:uncharacterized damage-inducible protein DinB